MTRVGGLNAVAAALAVGMSVALAGTQPAEESLAPERGRAVTHLVDAHGRRLELVDFGRIASASTVVDRLLWELCDPSKIIAVTRASADGPQGHRFAERPTIASIDRVEEILSLRPDLLLVHNVGDARRVERLREAGLEVFDLGPIRGRATLGQDIADVAAVCGASDRGARYARTIERRLDRVAVGASERRSGVYVSPYGGRWYGGAAGTSYHDVLEAAGLDDAAGGREGWPEYTVEALLLLDPEVVVTRQGERSTLCQHAILRRLRACPSDVIELSSELLDAPGPGMLEAAEALREALDLRAAERAEGE